MATESDDFLSRGVSEKIGQRFVRLGKIGFWGQLFPLIIGIFLAAYVVGISGQGQAERYLDLGNALSLGFYLIPIFTTFWCRRYIAIGHKLIEGDDPPSWPSLSRTVWVGVYAGVIGAILSLLFLFGAVFNLLYVLLSTPQIGLMVAPAAGAEDALSVSAIDAVSLLSLLVTLATELLVIWLSLWLVFAVKSQSDSAS